MHAAPHALRDVRRPGGTAVEVVVTGHSGGVWSVERDGSRWRLFEGRTGEGAASVVTIGDASLWRLATKGIAFEEARSLATIEGDGSLGLALLRMVAILG